MVGNQNLVRVAVVHDPRHAIPLQGTWIGNASDPALPVTRPSRSSATRSIDNSLAAIFLH
jgi:hypothetical protein